MLACLLKFYLDIRYPFKSLMRLLLSLKAIQDGREHVLTSGHKFATISQIVWEENKALAIIKIDIKLVSYE